MNNGRLVNFCRNHPGRKPEKFNLLLILKLYSKCISLDIASGPTDERPIDVSTFYNFTTLAYITHGKAESMPSWCIETTYMPS